MQCAVIEYARNVCGMEGANSSEFDAETKFPVIDLMPDQVDVEEKGGTMRLGLYPCKFMPVLLHRRLTAKNLFMNATVTVTK